MNTRDKIAAIATAPGRAGIGIVRISGPDLTAFASALTGHELPPRRAVLTAFQDAAGDAIDQGLALYFPAPHSYTGDDVLELHGHGGPVVLRMLLQRCVDLGARIARPGEFTERAFLSGKLNLAQAESVVDLIDASTTQAARSAMRSLRGQFSTQIQALTSSLVELRAFVEATLDFPEEEVDFLEQTVVGERLRELRRRVEDVLGVACQGRLLRDGIHVVLAGQPNVGKSSLLNRLAGEDLAIVTDVPGTTRDAIRQALDIGGVPAFIVDTAGLRATTDTVERIGVERAWQAISEADAVILLIDATVGPTSADEAIRSRLPPAPLIRAMNKIDLTGQPARVEESGETTVWLSAKTGAGIDLLRAALLQAVGWEGHGESVFLARARHLSALHTAAGHLAVAAERGRQMELFAEELRLAHLALGTITGEFTSDDLLGEIFSRFCIGK